MLLNSITTLSAYPFESIQINLDNSVAPQLNARFGIRYRDNFWSNNPHILNFNPNLTLNQAGADAFIFSSPTLSSQFNLLQTTKFTQPTNLISVPADFPTFFQTSAIPLQNLLLTFRGGISAISIFPARPYPLLTKINNNSFSVSGVYADLYSTNKDISNLEYRQSSKTISNLETKGTTLVMSSSAGNSLRFFPDIFKSSHKNEYLFASPTNNVIDIAFHNALLPDSNIIPETFFIQMPLSSTYAYVPYKMCFGNYLNSEYASLSSIRLLNVVAPIVSANVSRSGLLNLKIHPDFIIPKDVDILVSYETSAFPFSVSPFVQETTAQQLNVNNFILSAEHSSYLFNYKFKMNNVNGINDAFLINFSPSAFFISNSSLSSVSFSSVMIDNYKQTFYPITKKDVSVKFSDNLIGTSRLSAMDESSQIVYLENEWIPASATVLLFNEGNVSTSNLTLTYSATNNSIWDFQLPAFPLNKDKSQIFLTLTNSTDTSAKIIGSIAPNYNPSNLVKWSVSPSDNIILSNNNTTIPIDTFVQAGTLEIDVKNLGIEPTTISLYHQDYDVSQSVVWFPPPNSLSAASFLVSGTPINDFDHVKFCSVSALFIKNGLYYRCPTNNIIIWNENANLSLGHTEFYSNTSLLYENAAYTSDLAHTSIDVKFTTNLTPQLPRNIIFIINATYLADSTSFTKDLILYAREYPLNSPLNATINTTGASFNTISAESWVYTSNQIVSAYINLSSFSSYNVNNFKWQTPLGITTGISATFPLSANYTLSFSAISARPLAGGFDYYNFINTVDLYVLNPNNVLDFIAFPSIRYFPPLELNSTNFNESVGLTALSTCKNQFITISANKTFDEYFYKIGSKTLSSTENPFLFSSNASDVLSSGAIQITGFNSVFSKTQPFTTLNYVSSDNSSRFKQNVSFITIPLLSSTIDISQNLFTIRNPSLIEIDLSYSTNFPIVGGRYQFCLSANNVVKYSEHFSQETTFVRDEFTNNLSDFFSISADTFNEMNLFTIATLTGQTYDNCNFVQTISSNVIPITAYDSENPRLNVYTPINIISTNTLISFENVTTNLLPTPPSSYHFDNGTGLIQNTVSLATPFSGFYPTEGMYNISLSAVVNGVTIGQTWNNFIIVKNDFDTYISESVRSFDASLSLPYKCSDIISPNSWQFAKTLNDSFNKIKTNFEFLSAMGTAYNINIPKYKIGYWGRSSNGLEQWCYDNSIPLNSSIFDIKDGIILNDKLYIINNNLIEIRNFDFNMSKYMTIENITESEKFISPSNISYNTFLQKIIILDRDQKTIYVFEKDTFKLSNYWGGEGDVLSKTRFSDPCDMSIDSSNILYITDKIQKVVKIYGSTLNWLTTLSHADWESDPPISTFASQDIIYVLTTNGIIFTFESFTFTDKFPASSGKKLYVNDNIIYILNDKTTCYGKNGSFINSFNEQNILKLIFDNHELFTITKNSLGKYIEYLEYSKIIAYNLTPNLWSWNSINIDSSELITDFSLNDSFKKIHDNIFILHSLITDKYSLLKNEFDKSISFRKRPILSSERMLSSSSFSAIGLNELVSFDVIYRNIQNICFDMNLLKDTLEFVDEYESLSGHCWQWKNLRSDIYQRPNNNKNPISWIELTKRSSYPNISATTWLNAKKCCDDFTILPVCWTWDNLYCGCPHGITWQQIAVKDASTQSGKTWNSVSADCCQDATEFFANCISVC